MESVYSFGCLLFNLLKVQQENFVSCSAYAYLHGMDAGSGQCTMLLLHCLCKALSFIVGKEKNLKNQQVSLSVFYIQWA